MAETATRLPVNVEKAESSGRSVGRLGSSLETIQRDLDRYFDRFQRSMWRSPLEALRMDLEPLWPKTANFGDLPATDFAEDEKSCTVTAEVPGMEEKDLDVQFADGMLTIKGEKEETKEEKEKDRYLSERRYGSFRRCLRLPDGIDAGKIQASLKNGILTVQLPKTVEAQKNATKIAIKKA